jgi:hypothetical protein
MQLAGELAKMNLASLIRLVRNGELTGKVCLNQGVNTAFIFFETGQPIHVETDYGTGREALLELFLWQSGTFSYIECPVGGMPCSLSADEPLEKLLKEGLAYQEALRYLEQLRVSSRTIFRANDASSDDPLLAKMDGKTTLGDIVQSLGLSRSEYVLGLKQLVATGKALVVEAPVNGQGIQLPDWVVSRLKQDNEDVSQSIVQLVIWADRIKCWLYQADVDLKRVIVALDNTETTNLVQNDEEISPDYFQPQESVLEQEIASNLSSFESRQMVPNPDSGSVSGLVSESYLVGMASEAASGSVSRPGSGSLSGSASGFTRTPSESDSGATSGATPGLVSSGSDSRQISENENSVPAQSAEPGSRAKPSPPSYEF